MDITGYITNIYNQPSEYETHFSYRIVKNISIQLTMEKVNVPSNHNCPWVFLVLSFSIIRDTDVVLKTYLGRWTIGRSDERGSGISELPARYDDDGDVKPGRPSGQFITISFRGNKKGPRGHNWIYYKYI